MFGKSSIYQYCYYFNYSIIVILINNDVHITYILLSYGSKVVANCNLWTPANLLNKLQTIIVNETKYFTKNQN